MKKDQKCPQSISLATVHCELPKDKVWDFAHSHWIMELLFKELKVLPFTKYL